MPQTQYTYGGDGPIIHMALANGFPPETYAPLLLPLTDRYCVVSFPPRPLWDNPPEPHALHSWAEMGDDILTALADNDMRPVIGIGHSMGAVATMLAAIKEPSRFRGIVLLDPTIFPPNALRVMGFMRAIGLESRFPLVKKALRRRTQFESVEAAYAYWRKKSLFADWPDETVRLYAEGMTTPHPNGVTLRWSPAWEARYYATVYTQSWRMVRKLDGVVPVLTIRGTTTNTFFASSATLMQQLVPSMTYAEIEGGHLFPQSAPDATRAILTNWLDGLD